MIKAEQFNGASVHEHENSYTSKCSECIASDTGSSKIYNCVTCAAVFDRHLIAAQTLWSKCNSVALVPDHRSVKKLAKCRSVTYAANYFVQS